MADLARIVFLGDDFTGASDTLATFAERGAAVRLFLDVPDPAEADGLDVIGIATDLRPLSPDIIVRRLEELAPGLRRLSPRILHYKICSTFDSARHVGSIGAAVLTLERLLATGRTVVVGGQPSLGRYCIFGTLFARAADGRVCRIDRHPVMSRHPTTPMGEADIRAHLALQGLDDLALIDCLELNRTEELPPAMRNGAGRALIDALSPSDVDRIGRILTTLEAATAPLLVVGASSVAEALCPRLAQSRSRAVTGVGPRLAVAGSRSAVTADQVEAAASYVRLPIEPCDLDAGADRLVRHCADLLATGRDVLIHLRRDHDYGMPPASLSGRLAKLTAAIAGRCPVGAIAVAGGDTASAVVKRLGFRSLSFVRRAAPGVAVCSGHMPGHALEGAFLLLKGGQVGDRDILERFGRPF